MFRQIGPTEILLILGVVLLLFGGRKLPELARGSGRALRIFKSEVKDLNDDSKDDRADRDALETGDAANPVVRPEEPVVRPEQPRSTPREQG